MGRVVERLQSSLDTPNEFDEINEVSRSERGLNSYISLISYAMKDQRPAPPYAEVPTGSAMMALPEETALVDR